MSPSPQELARRASGETGLEFEGSEGLDGEGRRWIDLYPAGHPTGHTFALRTSLGWRRLDITFRPGRFAGELLETMGRADETGRRAFASILGVCRADGADVTFGVNGQAADPADAGVWTPPWRNLELSIRRGMLAINEGDPAEDRRVVELWASRAAAAITAILPLETEAMEQDLVSAETTGLPEGAKMRVEVNRYERDRRNRAAALAIHGYACKACDLDMAQRYGPAATRLIEVHHVTPVSEVGEGYVIDPATDLVPLCPNCHSVAHRRSPPYAVDEIRSMLGLVMTQPAAAAPQ